MQSLCLAILSLVLVASSVADEPSCSVKEKKDCGYSGINQQQCEQKGCCWVPVEGDNPQDTPWCFFKGVAPSPPPIHTGEPFNTSEVALMRSYFELNLNIAGKGGVVASPDHNTPGGSYFYAWARDAALSMNAYLMTSPTFDTARTNMEAYAEWVLKIQSETDPNNIDVRIEPKFNLPNGEPYTGGWCRPQTDGPGLRALTLINFANELLSVGASDFVQQYLWTDGAFNGGAIKHDLDWVMANWQSNGCDLWEEVQSSDFFWNRFNFKNTLYQASKFAMSQGDQDLANSYNNTAAQIAATLKNHWTGTYIKEEDNRQIDGAVICALNDGYTGGAVDDDYSPISTQVASTVKAYNDAFTKEYPVNVNDNNAGVPGILYGRYPGDHYAGGNPWVLTSNCLGQLYYRGATHVLRAIRDNTADATLGAKWREVLGLSPRSSHLELAAALANEGDGVLNRVRYHVQGDNFHLAEQIDKNSGFQTSAADLTWSYATVLKAMHSRSEYVAELGALQSRKTSNSALQPVV